LRTKECIPTFFSSIIFTLGLTFEYFKIFRDVTNRHTTSLFEQYE
jgi:hypothetical protein